jgi:putative PIN family toxin of toxin-antitoxin system
MVSVVKLVLDTNIALDWLVFADASCRGLDRAVEKRSVEVVVNVLAIEEMRRVLAYPQFSLDPSPRAKLLARYQSLASNASMPPEFSRDNLLLPAGFPRCRDRDDDHFLALAYHVKADALVTRDKQILALARRAAKFDVQVLDIRRLHELLDEH